jgi:pimeloyl-ACP methyl ester carboxylesterase
MSPKIITHRFPASDGISVVADVGGDPGAPAVILMHGGGQTRHSWGSAMRELLVEGYHVINLDARGHGDSDWSPDGHYRLDAFAGDLRAVIATLPSAPALFGASLGAATGLYAVGNSPSELASGLVLVDLVPRVEVAGSNKIQEFMRSRPEGFATLEDAVDAVAAYYPHRPRPKDTSGLMKNLRLRSDGQLHWHWDPKFIQARTRMEPPQFSEALLDAATRVRVPTLLVRGLLSDIVSDTGVAEFRQQLPRLEVYDVSGAGHMVAGDKNDAFNRGVIEFLRRHLPVR